MIAENKSVIRNKSFDFAIRIVNLYKTLNADRKEFTMSKQLLRSGTSIGANIEEATAAFSKKEFIVKMQISYKEAFESLYWLKLLHKTEYLKTNEFESLKANSEEIIKILTSILKTSKQSLVTKL